MYGKNKTLVIWHTNIFFSNKTLAYFLFTFMLTLPMSLISFSHKHASQIYSHFSTSHVWIIKQSTPAVCIRCTDIYYLAVHQFTPVVLMLRPKLSNNSVNFIVGALVSFVAVLLFLSSCLRFYSSVSTSAPLMLQRYNTWWVYYREEL